jgi:hypothetical protein
MSTDESSTSPSEAEIAAEVVNRVQIESPLLAEHLRSWLQAHQTPPRAISVSSDLDGTRTVQVWLVTDQIGDSDASSRVVYDAARKMFGLVMELETGVLWYMGPYGSLVDTVESM